MKRFLTLLLLFYIYSGIAIAQSHRAAIRNGHGATSIEEIGQAVFKALQKNDFNNLQNYLPDEVELRKLSRHSSKDMRALLQTLSPDSIRQNFQKQFIQISKGSTSNAFNWDEWELASTSSTQHDPHNPALYSIDILMSNASGKESHLIFEAINIQKHYFLFRQITFHSKS